MKKKSLAVIISLAAVFGLTSCNKVNNKKVTTTETTAQEDTKNVEEAYKVLDSKMSYESFLDKVKKVEYDYSDLEIYSIVESDLVFSIAFKNDVKYSYVRSVGDTNKHLVFYRYGGYGYWYNIGEISIKSDETLIYISESFIDKEAVISDFNTLDFKNQDYEKLMEKMLVCFLGENRDRNINLLPDLRKFEYDHVHKVDIVFEENHEEVKRVVYTYKMFKPISIEKYEIDDAGNMSLNTKDVFTYDDTYTLTSEIRYEPKYGDIFYWTSKKEYKDGVLYSKVEVSNNIIYDHFSYSRVESEYVDNRLVQEVFYNYKNEDLVATKKITYENDKKGNVTSQTEYIYENDAWMPSKREEYSVLEDGTRICLYFEYNGSGWVKTSKEERTYTTFGNVATITISDYKNSEWVINRKEEYKYDSIGRYLEISDLTYSNGTLILGYKDEYTYNDNDAIEFVTCSTYDAGEWQYTLKKEIKYLRPNINSSASETMDVTLDRHGRLMSHTYKYYKERDIYVSELKYSNGEFVYSRKEEYIPGGQNKYYKYENDAWVEIDYNTYSSLD